ncbi:hypothetical protein FDP25_12440 [Roseovarius sp. A21]|uniref:DUF6455 domain-containing protein n=1 Tax=Roseovarius bejariae TaxID=2576383 RepID=A0A844CNR4_9RHOB|nr:DUF6455 family protein [Roseovarius bejariae]MRU16242.1 hypothetical protein [Roseovarius bejariae]
MPDVTPLGHPRHHYWLVQGMARATGLDLPGAVREGRLGLHDWADIVHHCRSCAGAGWCDQWLAGDPHVTSPPRTCRNRAALAALKIEQELAKA